MAIGRVAKRNNGCSGCGIVVTAVDMESWITISEIAAPLKASTAMATEVAGVRNLIEVRDLRVEKEMNMQTVTDCIDRIVDDTETENRE